MNEQMIKMLVNMAGIDLAEIKPRFENIVRFISAIEPTLERIEKQNLAILTEMARLREFMEGSVTPYDGPVLTPDVFTALGYLDPENPVDLVDVKLPMRIGHDGSDCDGQLVIDGDAIERRLNFGSDNYAN